MSIRINVGATFDARDIKLARKELDALEDQARQLTGGMATAVRGLEKFSRGAMAVGSVLTKAVTVPLIGAGLGAIKTAADFQMSMSKIVGLVGIASHEVKAMEGAVLSLSRETARAPQELADALFVVTSAGLRGAEATDALRVSAKAAAAGLGTTADIARSVAGIMNSYGSRVGSAAQVTDVLVATARAGNFETSQLAGALGRVLPFATQAQVSIEDLGGAIALLTRTNGNAAESITQIQSLFRAFVVPTEEAKKVLDEVGLSAGELRDQMGREGLVSTLRTLDGALDGNREKLGRLLGSSEAASAAFQILDADANALSDTFGVTNNAVGLTDSAFRTAAEQSAFKFTQALNDLKVVAVELGNELLPIATDIVEKIRDLTGRFTELDKEQQKFLLKMLGIASAVGPAIILLGSLAQTLSLLAIAAATFGIALAPVLVVVGAIALAAVGVGLAFRDMKKDAEEAASASRIAFAEARGASGRGFDRGGSGNRAARKEAKELADALAAADKRSQEALASLEKFGEEADGSGGTGEKVFKLTGNMKNLLREMNETQVGTSDSGDAIAQFAREMLAAGTITDQTSRAAERLASVVRQNLDKALAEGNRRLDEAKRKFDSYRDAIAGGVRGGNTLSDSVSGQTAALEALTRAEEDYEKAVASDDPERIEEAHKALDAARKTQTSFLSFLQTGADTAEGFAQQIDSLRLAGASMDVVRQIAELGARTGGRVIAELMAGGAEAIDQANRLVASVEESSLRAGVAAAKQFHSAGIEAAKQFIQAIEDTIPELQIVLNQIADMIGKALGVRPQVNLTGGPTFLPPGAPPAPRRETAREKFNRELEESLRVLFPGKGLSMFADGGIVTGPTLGMVGEAGPEAIIPLDRAGSLGTTININVSGAIDPEGTARQIRRILQDAERRSGVRVLS